MNGRRRKIKKSWKIIARRTVSFMLAVIVMFIFISICFFASDDISAQEKKTVRANRNVVVAWYDEGNFQKKDENGNRSGYGYDYLSTIAWYAGWNLQFVESDLSTFMRYFNGELEEKDIPEEWKGRRPDLICGIEHTEENEKFLNFPDLAMLADTYYIFAPDDEDDRYINNKYLFDPDITISGAKDSIEVDKLKDWKNRNGYKFTIKEIAADAGKNLSSKDIRLKDLQKKTDDPLRIADLTVDSGNHIMKTDGLTPLKRIGSMDGFVAVRKSSSDLIYGLNEAQAKLLNNDPFFTTEISKKYYSNSALRNVLTVEEELWVKNNDELKVGIYDDYVPFSDYNDGEMTGLFSDLINYVQKEWNISLTLKYFPYNSYNKMLEDLAVGNIDIATPVYTSNYRANEFGILITKPVTDTSMYWVYKDDSMENALKEKKNGLRIAIVGDSPLQRAILEDYYSEYEEDTHYVKDWRESIDAILKGEADGTLLNVYRVNINLRNSKRLKTKEAVGVCNLSLGINSGNTELLGILNRAISDYGKGNASESLMRHAEAAYKTTFSDFIKENYLWFNAIVIAVAVIIGLLLLYISLKKKQRMIFENMAKRDSVTGLRNRRSFEEDVKKISENILPADLIVAVMDIDELKKTNDLYGHAAGDEVIRGAAYCINSVIDEYGRLYKSGGDEFLAIFKGSHEQYEKIKKEIAGKIALWKGEYVKKLSVSSGYVELREYPNADIKELMKIADERMYTQKFASGHTYRIRSNGGRLKNIEGYEYLLHNKEDENLLEAFVSAYEAQYDTLTGLPSMSYFLEMVSSADNEVFRVDGLPIMVSFNFNGLKGYNDKFGLQAGNDLLISFAVIIEESFGKDNCSRFGEDHFFAFTTDKIFDAKIPQIMDDIAGINNGKSLTMRIGVYSYNENDDISPSAACDRAQVAGDHARKSTDTKIVVYDEKIQHEVQMKDFIINNIDSAIAEGYIKAFYQPKINTVDESLYGFEALARWIDPEKGMISPGEFIPVLEDFNLTWKIDHCILQQVAGDIIKAKKMGLPLYPVSFNISRTDFMVTDPYENLIYTVKLYGLTRDLFNVEITESSVMNDPTGIKEQVKRFKKSGFEVLMDDFGSGYSSLGTLRDFDFDGIKIDMSFMRNFGERSMAIIEPMVEMAKNLGIKTIAEGVETQEQLDFLKKVGCDQIQGYYFGKPESFDAVVKKYVKKDTD